MLFKQAILKADNELFTVLPANVEVKVRIMEPQEVGGELDQPRQHKVGQSDEESGKVLVQSN